MITTSDIITKLIYDAGFKNLKDFTLKNNFNYQNFHVCVCENTWTKQMLAKVGNALGKDLSKLFTATIGREVGTRCKFE
jgi:hypothetical protein